MEAMEAESEGNFTYRQIYEYIKDGKCPEVLKMCDLVGKNPNSHILTGVVTSIAVWTLYHPKYACLEG